MKCTNCQTELPINAKFCPNCGTPTQITCPKCQTVVTPGAKFCHNCGTALQNSAVVKTSCATPAADNKNPSYKERLAELADCARYEELLSFCKEEITKNPDNEDIFTNLAELITSDKITNPKNFLEELQKIFPENTNIKFLFALWFITQEDWQQAWSITEDIMRSVDTLNKENQATLYFFRFSILLNMTDSPSSPAEEMQKVENLREFLSKEDKNTFDYYKGLFLVSEKKFQEAFEVADNLLPNNPDDLNVRYLRALAALSGDKDGWIEDLETIWNSPNVTEELKENIKNLLDNRLPLDNTFIIEYHEAFYQDIMAFLTEYRETKEISSSVGIFSAPKIARLAQEAVHNAFRCLRQATQEIHTDEMKKDLLDLENRIIQKAQQNIKPFLDELPRLKKEILEQCSDSGISDFVGGLVKGATFGWLGVVDGFIEGNKKDKIQEQAFQEWNNNVQEIAEIMDNAWTDCLKSLSDLCEKYPLLCLWESEALDNFLAEQSGINSPLLPLLKEAANGDDSVFLAPDIPPVKLGAAKKTYACVRKDEKILALFDSTVLGGAEDGAVFTDKGFYWNDGKTGHIAYDRIQSVFVLKSTSKLKVLTDSGVYQEFDFSLSENQLLECMLKAVKEYMEQEKNSNEL